MVTVAIGAGRDNRLVVDISGGRHGGCRVRRRAIGVVDGDVRRRFEKGLVAVGVGGAC